MFCDMVDMQSLFTTCMHYFCYGMAAAMDTIALDGSTETKTKPARLWGYRTGTWAPFACLSIDLLRL